jgi:plastocyanin
MASRKGIEMKAIAFPMAAALISAAVLPVRSAPHMAAVPSPATKVTIDNFEFKPKELTISRGTTVTWTNRDDVPHTATSNGNPPVFDSKALDTDDSYSFTFARPGTYTYYCKVHNHMTGRVIVK